jgi:hypothetical protein
MNIGLINDIKGEYLEAIRHYENEIDSNEFPNINNFTNLAFLYWAFATEQNEFNIPNNIPDEWSIIGGKRFSIIIKKGIIKYPNSIELNFWKQYFPHRLFGDKFSENDCKNLLKKYGENESLVPYFFLYLFDNQRYRDRTNKLLEICINMPTAKNNYIKSFLFDPPPR